MITAGRRLQMTMRFCLPFSVLLFALFAPLLRADSGPAYYCLCDINLDRAVNFGDLGLLRSDFFSDNLRSDFNGDGRVSFADLGIMRAHFFDACPAAPAHSAAVPVLEPSHRYALVRSILGSGPGIMNVYVLKDGTITSEYGELNPEVLRGYVVFASESRDEFAPRLPWSNE